MNALIEDTDDFFRENKQALDPQLESEEWGKLCALCQSEVKKANNELVQLLEFIEDMQDKEVLQLLRDSHTAIKNGEPGISVEESFARIRASRKKS